ncbi:hypothetical protein C0J52_05265 [Blattella germanica]|nr:hypothetical protein C0J52_05265 [Blattella germanica]
MDETGLYFRAVPDKSMKFQSKDQIQECITLAFCINALGDKEPPIVVHSRCDALQPDVDWYVNGHFWITSDIFSQWVTKFNNKMIKEDRKIILLLDEAPCHPLLELSNVKFIFLPSRLQPLGQGIIQTFKMLYRRRMLRSLVARMNNTVSISQLAQQITLSDAVTWVKSAWSEVKPAIAQRQFLISGLKMENINVTIEDDIATELDNIAIEITSLGEAAGIEVDLEPEENNHVVSSYDVNGDWEQQLLGSNWDEESNGYINLEKTEKASVNPMPLDQALNSIIALKALANNLGDCTKLKKALEVAEEELENIIVAQKLE